MSQLVIATAAEQLATYLREGILQGLWSGVMPCGDRLAAELGVGRNTAEAALDLLEQEGVLKSQGRRRGRIVVTQLSKVSTPSLRIGILLSESRELTLDYIVEIRHELEKAGHISFPAPKTMADLAMDTLRIQRMTGKMEVDAWLVIGASYELLDGFTRGQKPAFALFGRRRELPIAGTGPDKYAAIIAATRQLIDLGHRRIVMMARTRRRQPKPGRPEQAFLDVLAANGLPSGEYNLPHWEETTQAYHRRLEELFRVTPPTALIIDEPSFFFATQQFLGRSGLISPENVSLVCTDYSPDFDWCHPAISHIRWRTRPLVRHILKWVTHVCHGKQDLHQTEIRAEFVQGGTIGPVKIC